MSQQPTTSTGAPAPTDAAATQTQNPSSAPDHRGRLGWIVVVSLLCGLVAAGLLVAAPVIRPEEAAVTGAVLLGFAVGWILLAVLSALFTDQPQMWAAVPAVAMGFGSALLLGFGSSVRGVLDWIWPPVMLAVAIWMAVRAHRVLRSRTRRWLLYPVITVIALAAIGGGYQTLGAAADSRAFPRPGELISVDGHRLHLHCTGSQTPTVVLEPGAGLMSSNVAWISTAVAEDTRVCAYDRAGRGWSEPADDVQDADQIAADLHSLLQRGNVPGPYVLAGHSFGGLYVLTFAAKYPDDVAGLVLIDTTAPASSPAPRPVAGALPAGVRRLSALASIAARIGLTRLYALTEGAGLPPQARAEFRASEATPENLRTTISEYAVAGASAQQAAALRDLDNTPLVVLTAGIGSDAELVARHDQLANLSSNSAHRLVEGASHESLVHDEEDAAATTQAIVEVVAAVRSGAQLPADTP